MGCLSCMLAFNTLIVSLFFAFQFLYKFPFDPKKEKLVVPNIVTITLYQNSLQFSIQIVSCNGVYFLCLFLSELCGT